MASISTRNISSDSFQARVTGMDTGVTKNITWFIDGDEWDYQEPSDSSSTSSWVTFDGLDSDTEYEIVASIYYENGAWADELVDYITTESDGGSGYEPDVSSIYIQQRTADDPATEIAVRARGFDTDYSETDWELTWYIHDPSLSDTTLIDSISDEVSAGSGNSSTITFSGLFPETIYEIELRVRYYVNGDRNTKWLYETLSTESMSSSEERPDYFEWDAEKVKGKPFNVTANEWRRLLDNINEICVYKGLTSVSSTSYADEIAYFYYPSRGEGFLASMYNQCIYQFQRLGLLLYSDYQVYSGDEITADKINFLRDMINEVN